MVEDTPNDLVHDIAAEAVFGTHPLGRPVIGRADVISSVSRRALAGYHGRAYRGDKIVLAAAGNVRHDELVALLEARRNGSSEGRSLAARKPARANGTPGVRFQRKDTEQYHVCLSAPGISRLDERRFAASLMDAIIGGSASSRLFQEIREKVARPFGSGLVPVRRRGQIGIYVGMREAISAECLEIAVASYRTLPPGTSALTNCLGEGEPQSRILLSLRRLGADDAAREVDVLLRTRRS